MKKRAFITVLILGMIVAVTTPGVAEDEVITWRMQGGVVGMTTYERCQRLAEEVKRATAGRLVIEHYPDGAIVHPSEGITAVSEGRYEIQVAGSTAARGGEKFGPVANLFNVVPGGFNSLGGRMWYEHGGGKELHQELFDRSGFHIKLFALHPARMQNFLWANKPLRTLEDFKGVRMRMEHGMGEILAKHGFFVAFTLPDEIIFSLQRGLIDAAEWSGAYGDKGLGLWKVCKYVMLPGVHHPGGAGSSILVNKAAYATLPEEVKIQLEAAIYSVSFKLWIRYQVKDLEAVEFFKEQGIETVFMEPETVETFVKWTREYYDELATQDEFFAKVWNSQRAFAEKWYPYIRTHTLPH